VHGNQEIDELFVGIDNIGFPNLLTVSEGKIQLYSKYSGSVAITNFSCGKVLSELLSFKMDDERCKILMNKLTTGN